MQTICCKYLVFLNLIIQIKFEKQTEVRRQSVPKCKFDTQYNIISTAGRKKEKRGGWCFGFFIFNAGSLA